MKTITITKIVIGFILLSNLFLVNGQSVDTVDAELTFSWLTSKDNWHTWIGCTEQNSSLLQQNIFIGQPIKCKLVLQTNVQGNLHFTIYEPGTTLAYTVVKGKKQDESVQYWLRNTLAQRPSEKYEQQYIFELIPSVIRYTWILIPNGNWTQGNAPINLYYSFTSIDNKEEHCHLGFCNPFIINQNWTGSTYTELNEKNMYNTTLNDVNQYEFFHQKNNESNGLQFGFILLIILFTSIYLTDKKKN